MPVTRQSYDQFKVEKLKHYLEDMAAKGQPRLYEIFVDNLKVVPKTEDIAQFDSYEQYLDEDTEKVRILIYNTSLSPRNDQYYFLVQPGKIDKKPENGLGEIDTIIQEKLAEKEREYEMAALRKELEASRQQLHEVETEAEELRQELDEVRAGRADKQMKLFDLAAGLCQGWMRNNPKVLQRLPGGEALAGLIGLDEGGKSLPDATAPKSEASFQRKEAGPDELRPDQLRYLDTLKQLEGAFQQPELEMVMQIIARFAEDPGTLKTVSELLNIQNP